MVENGALNSDKTIKADVLVAEIGSTTTLVNAFSLGKASGLIGQAQQAPKLIGHGQAPTSVFGEDSDVQIGLKAAIKNLCHNLSTEEIEYDHFLATSSAAGGLRMTIHGLVYDMTVKAGKEAALGAGANIQLATAGKLECDDLRQIDKISPNLILLAGGTDYGDRDVALHNAKLLSGLSCQAPIVYCGNIQNHGAVSEIFNNAGRRLYITENVYPRLDELNIEPIRALIHSAFEEHIVHAPGMQGIRNMVNGAIMPTPGAVMAAARLLYDDIGDLLVVDVVGATTDVHSVSHGAEDIVALQISPEPFAKRTVEGDLGVFVNARNLAEMVGFDKLLAEISKGSEFGLDNGIDIAKIFEDYRPIAQNPAQLALTTRLSYHAASIAICRHAGTLRYTYGATGRKTHAMGKDLTMVKNLIATGGALTRLPGRKNVLEALCNLNASGLMLYPKPRVVSEGMSGEMPGGMGIMEDKRYIMASIGVLARDFEDAARALLLKYVVER